MRAEPWPDVSRHGINHTISFGCDYCATTLQARSARSLRSRWGCRRRIGLLRHYALLALRCHRGAIPKAHAIDQQILHHALDIVAGFGKRDALDPVDRIDLGIARIAERREPFPDAAPAGVVAGKGHDVVALVFR